jgi:hypothetical protein
VHFTSCFAHCIFLAPSVRAPILAGLGQVIHRKISGDHRPSLALARFGSVPGIILKLELEPRDQVRRVRLGALPR